MTPHSDTPQEDEFAGLLAACDEALAAGEPPPTDGPAEAATELRPRLERGLSCLRRLQQLRPGHTPMPTLPALWHHPQSPSSDATVMSQSPCSGGPHLPSADRRDTRVHTAPVRASREEEMWEIGRASHGGPRGHCYLRTRFPG